MRLFTIDLKEIKSINSDKGLINTELLPDYPIWGIGTAIAYNHQFYTRLSAGKTIFLEDTPTDILRKIKKSVKLSSALYDYRYPCDPRRKNEICQYADKFRIFNDWEKSILINLEFLKYAEPISKFQTKLVYGNKWDIIIRLPVEMLDIPNRKVRLPINYMPKYKLRKAH